MISHDTLAQFWEVRLLHLLSELHFVDDPRSRVPQEFGHISYYRRVNIEDHIYEEMEFPSSVNLAKRP